MVGKIGLTTDTLRNLSGGMETTTDEPSWLKKVALGVNGLAASAALFFISPFGLRLNVVNRLMTNKTFAESFQDGKFLSLHMNNSEKYMKATASPENFKDIIPNTINHFKITFGLAKKLKQDGLTYGNSFLKGLSSLEKISVIAAPIGALVLLAFTVRNYFKKPEPQSDMRITTTPEHGKEAAEFAREMKQKGVSVDTEMRFGDGSVGKLETDALLHIDPASGTKTIVPAATTPASLAAQKPADTIAHRIAAEKMAETGVLQK